MSRIVQSWKVQRHLVHVVLDVGVAMWMVRMLNPLSKELFEKTEAHIVSLGIFIRLFLCEY